MLMIAPLPLEMMMPVSLTEIIAPVVVLIRMPPVGPGTSLIVRPFCSGVCKVMPGTRRAERSGPSPAPRPRCHKSSQSRSGNRDRRARIRSRPPSR